MGRQGIGLFVGLVFILTGLPSHAADEYEDPSPSLELGAAVYATRCVLCHGNRVQESSWQLLP